MRYLVSRVCLLFGTSTLEARTSGATCQTWKALVTSLLNFADSGSLMMREHPARPNIEHLGKYKRLTGPIPGQTADTQGDTNSLAFGKLKEHQGSVHRGRNDHNAASN